MIYSEKMEKLHNEVMENFNGAVKLFNDCKNDIKGYCEVCCEELNEKYKGLIGKKVTIYITNSKHDTERNSPQQTRTGYFEGFQVLNKYSYSLNSYAEVYPLLFQVLKDGSKGKRKSDFFWQVEHIDRIELAE